MTFKLFTIEELNETYARFCVAEGILNHVLERTEEGYRVYARQIAIIIKDLAMVKLDHPFASNDLFKLELCLGMNQCLKDTELTNKYGKCWLAEDDRILRIFDLIEETVREYNQQSTSN